MEEAYVGTVILFAGNFAPSDWAFCDGQTLQISKSDNQPLFSLVGTTYGGDGIRNFNLPDTRKKEADLGGMRYIIRVKMGIYPQRP
jgi:microcystin-dependent protein